MKEAEIGSLKVRTVGEGTNRVKVVLLPGHEFGIEHFLPENLAEEVSISSRTTQFTSRINQEVKFMAKYSRDANHLRISNEARIARFLNNFIRENGISGIFIEEPLAFVKRGSFAPRVFYRAVAPPLFFPKDVAKAKQFFERIRAIGVTPNDHLSYNNLLTDSRGRVHVVDLESWKVSDKLKRKLKLTK